MTQLFTRSGEAPKAPVQFDAKGKPFMVTPRMCNRCGGAGRSDRWAFTGYTCFDCGGEGRRGEMSVKLYTAEKLAKLNATQAKAQAKRAAIAEAKAAQRAAEIAARAADFSAANATLIARAAPHIDNEFIADVMNRAIANSQISENQAAAVMAAIDRIETQERVRAASDYVGKVGERLSLVVTVERVSSFERPAFNAPWTTAVVNIVTMRDDAGNAIVAKGNFYAEKGSKLTIKATVKEHSTYRDERQTIVQRIKEAA